MINISNKLNTQYVNSNKVNFKGKPQKIFNTAAETLQRTVEDFEKMKKLVIINGSPRNDSISNTYKALMAETEYYKNKFPELETAYFKLPKDMNGCFNCKTCIPRCVQKGDNLKDIIDAMEDASDVMLGSPVYLDMPTPQTVAFLTRLNCMAENTDRRFFANKAIHLVSTAFCSGTKSCIHAMMGACEMLGFTIKGRSSREYIVKWSDTKLRGGLSRNDAIWLDK
ncbi:flavodoxin family protein [bacterium]|nr:flavodoxin family protein [bacterium]